MQKLVSLKNIAIKMFGRFADRYMGHFTQLRGALAQAGLKIILRTYISLAFFFTAVTWILAFASAILFSLLFGMNIWISIILIAVVPLLFAVAVLIIFFLYPVSRARSRAADIEANLPFALLHMATIAGSGVPPSSLFKILSRFQEYGEVSKEARHIVEAMDVFGLDEISALRESCEKTPSKTFREILQNIITTIQTGGSLSELLKQTADRILFEYRLNRERYNQLLATYADFYAALLIAAPLLLVVILTILNIFGGEVFGIPINIAILLGIFIIIPALNIIFIAFVHASQPRL